MMASFVLSASRRRGNEPEEVLVDESARTAGGWDGLLESFAAELASAAYSIALRHGEEHRWVDLELDLWRTLSATVQKRRGQVPPAECSDEFNGWRAELLAELTEAAYRTSLRYGAYGSFWEVKLGLFQAFRLVTDNFLMLRHPCFVSDNNGVGGPRFIVPGHSPH